MSETAEIVFIEPMPSSKYLPEWYKKNKPFVDNSKEPRIHKKNPEVTNATLKLCVPFLDAMSAGYTISLSSDVEFYKTNLGTVEAKWRTEHILIQDHHQEQTEYLPSKHNEINPVLKWVFGWKIETPKGYSCLYTHPFNRSDLPFRTFSGIVDTDMYPDAVHFPFQLFNFKEDFIIIEKGTPICQVFPFKREKWKSIKNKPVKNLQKIAAYQLLSKIQRSYKNQFWSKKEYS